MTAESSHETLNAILDSAVLGASAMNYAGPPSPFERAVVFSLYSEDGSDPVFKADKPDL